MLGIHDLPLFIASGLLLNLVPGPDTLLVVSRSATHGFRTGSAASLGIGAGILVHVLAAALGLSALMTASATAFDVIKWLGAIYLVYMGVQMWRAGPAHAHLGEQSDASMNARLAFRQGLITNVLNPKVALFFLAFVPQFIEPSTSSPWAFVLLGLVFNLNSMVWCHVLAYVASRARQRLRPAPWVGQRLQQGAGLLLLAFGLRLALARP